MAMASTSKRGREKQRKRRHVRVRRKVVGTAERPRLCVRKSLQHIYAQVVDDERGRTLVSASTMCPEIREQVNSPTVEAARLIGGLVARRALAVGVERVVFDRAGYPYRGKVQALADAAREEGLAL